MTPDQAGDALPAQKSEIPLPEWRPPTEDAEPGKRQAPGKPQPSVGRHNAVRAIPAVDEKMERAEEACRARLTALDVAFERRPPLSDLQGCSVPFPVAVTRLGKDVALDPEAVLNCGMAEAAAKFVRDVVSPAAKRVYGSELKAISQASAYVCRPRHGTAKLSEHAFGNALDIGGFTLTDGTEITVEATDDPKASKFLREVRNAACGPFKTVLGPGSDADHATHLHFDLALRRNGGTFCQ